MHDLDKTKINLNSEKIQNSIMITPATSPVKRNSFYHLFLKQFDELILSFIVVFIFYMQFKFMFQIYRFI
jgi:hypothetical protein